MRKTTHRRVETNIIVSYHAQARITNTRQSALPSKTNKPVGYNARHKHTVLFMIQGVYAKDHRK